MHTTMKKLLTILFIFVSLTTTTTSCLSASDRLERYATLANAEIRDRFPDEKAGMTIDSIVFKNNNVVYYYTSGDEEFEMMKESVDELSEFLKGSLKKSSEENKDMKAFTTACKENSSNIVYRYQKKSSGETITIEIPPSDF